MLTRPFWLEMNRETPSCYAVLPERSVDQKENCEADGSAVCRSRNSLRAVKKSNTFSTIYYTIPEAQPAGKLRSSLFHACAFRAAKEAAFFRAEVYDEAGNGSLI
ncbi:hypothetical protein [Candidatus Electronema sp. TJ]|uniref:hypothetical protein n=1 Tax=Candidatus Electronema sp. TJ TaxID=3401573 RepID=UPI003AA7F32D